MLIQIHMIQNYAPSNLNRDETGAPKTAQFGGYLRGRISSQCFKRSLLNSDAFQPFREAGQIGFLTQQLPMLICQELERMGIDPKSKDAIVKKVSQIGRKPRKNGKESNASPEDERTTKQLMRLAPNEIRPLAENLVELFKTHRSDWADMDLEKYIRPTAPVDVVIALAGRWITSSIFDKVEPAIQVAHPLSTNRMALEVDYFTGIDDLSEGAGAAHIGDIEFESSTFYKYLNVHWEQLLKNLHQDVQLAGRVTCVLIEAVAMSHPKGKQNSFAAFNPPELILIEISEKEPPVSYTNAFIRPVTPTGDKSLDNASVEKLFTYITKVTAIYDLKYERVFVSLSDCELPNAKRCTSLAELISWVQDRLPKESKQ